MLCFFFNSKQVIRQGSGTLVVARRPTEPVPAWQYVPCTLCLIFCQKDSLSHHIKQCPLKKEETKCIDSYQDGLMLLESYMPQGDALNCKVNELIEGMRDTQQTAGNIFLVYCNGAHTLRLHYRNGNNVFKC